MRSRGKTAKPTFLALIARCSLCTSAKLYVRFLNILMGEIRAHAKFALFGPVLVPPAMSFKVQLSNGFSKTIDLSPDVARQEPGLMANKRWQFCIVVQGGKCRLAFVIALATWGFYLSCYWHATWTLKAYWILNRRNRHSMQAFSSFRCFSKEPQHQHAPDNHRFDDGVLY